MSKQLLKDGIGWGLALWTIGYLLGIVLFFVVPSSIIGWLITPLGIAIAFLVLLKKVRGGSIFYFFEVGAIWVLIAILFDYIFIVKLLKPVDGYYKPDVYLYYALTFALPIVVGWFIKQKKVTT